MSNNNKKKVSIWKARHKEEFHPWAFFFVEDDQNFSVAMLEFGYRLRSQEITILYRSRMHPAARKVLRAAIRRMRREIDANEMASFDFVRVYSGTDEDRLEGLTPYKAAIRINIEEARRWLYENGHNLISSHEDDMKKNSTGLLYRIACGA